MPSSYPIDKNGLIAIMSDSNYLIMHMHGSPEAFIDQRTEDKHKTIVSLKTLKSSRSFLI